MFDLPSYLPFLLDLTDSDAIINLLTDAGGGREKGSCQEVRRVSVTRAVNSSPEPELALSPQELKAIKVEMEEFNHARVRSRML